MNCAERLVALFGSQAEVARRFQLDRAVVNNWVKSRLRAGALGDGGRARHRRPDQRGRRPQRSHRQKTAPAEIPARTAKACSGRPLRERHHERLRPGQAHPFLPSAAAHADGPGPDRDPSARAHHDEPAGDRLSRPGLRRDDGGAEVAAALRLPDEEPAHLPDLRARARSAWSTASSTWSRPATR